MKTVAISITTDDTKKKYPIPLPKGAPQIWALEAYIRGFNPTTANLEGSFGSVIVHVERQTLVDAGWIPATQGDAPPPKQKPTLHDLLIRILEEVGVYPSE